MPADFEKCVKSGGRVRTKKLGGGKYMHVCFKDGKSYAGEVKKKESLKWFSNFILEDEEVTVEEAMYGKNHQTDDGGAGKFSQMKGKKMHGTLMKRESRNGRIYELDAMIKAKNDVKLPIPVSMNHTEDVTDNVALITKLIPTGDGLDYEGIVYNTMKHPDAMEMMQKGLVSKISIEADNAITEEIGDKVIIKGFDLMGAGFVKYAGFDQASTSIAEALELNKNEVEDMEELEKQLHEKDKALEEANRKLEAHQKELQSKKLEEAQKIEQEKENKIKMLEESVTALTEKVETMKEAKKSGIITEDPKESPYQIKEKLEKGMPIAKTFIFETYSKDGKSFKGFFPANPSEFY